MANANRKRAPEGSVDLGLANVRTLLSQSFEKVKGLTEEELGDIPSLFTLQLKGEFSSSLGNLGSRLQLYLRAKGIQKTTLRFDVKDTSKTVRVVHVACADVADGHGLDSIRGETVEYQEDGKPASVVIEGVSHDGEYLQRICDACKSAERMAEEQVQAGQIRFGKLKAHFIEEAAFPFMGLVDRVIHRTLNGIGAIVEFKKGQVVAPQGGEHVKEKSAKEVSVCEQAPVEKGEEARKGEDQAVVDVQAGVEVQTDVAPPKVEPMYTAESDDASLKQVAPPTGEEASSDEDDDVVLLDTTLALPFTETDDGAVGLYVPKLSLSLSSLEKEEEASSDESDWKSGDPGDQFDHGEEESLSEWESDDADWTEGPVPTEEETTVHAVLCEVGLKPVSAPKDEGDEGEVPVAAQEEPSGNAKLESEDVEQVDEGDVEDKPTMPTGETAEKEDTPADSIWEASEAKPEKAAKVMTDGSELFDDPPVVSNLQKMFGGKVAQAPHTLDCLPRPTPMVVVNLGFRDAGERGPVPVRRVSPPTSSDKRGEYHGVTRKWTFGREGFSVSSVTPRQTKVETVGPVGNDVSGNAENGTPSVVQVSSSIGVLNFAVRAHGLTADEKPLPKREVKEKDTSVKPKSVEAKRVPPKPRPRKLAKIERDAAGHLVIGNKQRQPEATPRVPLNMHVDDGVIHTSVASVEKADFEYGAPSAHPRRPTKFGIRHWHDKSEWESMLEPSYFLSLERVAEHVPGQVHATSRKQKVVKATHFDKLFGPNRRDIPLLEDVRCNSESLRWKKKRLVGEKIRVERNEAPRPSVKFLTTVFLVCCMFCAGSYISRDETTTVPGSDLYDVVGRGLKDLMGVLTPILQDCRINSSSFFYNHYHFEYENTWLLGLLVIPWLKGYLTSLDVCMVLLAIVTTAGIPALALLALICVPQAPRLVYDCLCRVGVRCDLLMAVTDILIVCADTCLMSFSLMHYFCFPLAFFSTCFRRITGRNLFSKMRSFLQAILYGKIQLDKDGEFATSDEGVGQHGYYSAHVTSEVTTSEEYTPNTQCETAVTDRQLFVRHSVFGAIRLSILGRIPGRGLVCHGVRASSLYTASGSLIVADNIGRAALSYAGVVTPNFLGCLAFLSFFFFSMESAFVLSFLFFVVDNLVTQTSDLVVVNWHDSYVHKSVVPAAYKTLDQTSEDEFTASNIHVLGVWDLFALTLKSLFSKVFTKAVSMRFYTLKAVYPICTYTYFFDFFLFLFVLIDPSAGYLPMNPKKFIRENQYKLTEAARSSRLICAKQIRLSNTRRYIASRFGEQVALALGFSGETSKVARYGWDLIWLLLCQVALLAVFYFPAVAHFMFLFPFLFYIILIRLVVKPLTRVDLVMRVVSISSLLPLCYWGLRVLGLPTSSWIGGIEVTVASLCLSLTLVLLFIHQFFGAIALYFGWRSSTHKATDFVRKLQYVVDTLPHHILRSQDTIAVNAMFKRIGELRDRVVASPVVEDVSELEGLAKSAEVQVKELNKKVGELFVLLPHFNDLLSDVRGVCKEAKSKFSSSDISSRIFGGLRKIFSFIFCLCNSSYVGLIFLVFYACIMMFGEVEGAEIGFELDVTIGWDTFSNPLSLLWFLTKLLLLVVFLLLFAVVVVGQFILSIIRIIVNREGIRSLFRSNGGLGVSFFSFVLLLSLGVASGLNHQELYAGNVRAGGFHHASAAMDVVGVFSYAMRGVFVLSLAALAYYFMSAFFLVSVFVIHMGVANLLVSFIFGIPHIFVSLGFSQGFFFIGLIFLWIWLYTTANITLFFLRRWLNTFPTEVFRFTGQDISQFWIKNAVVAWLAFITGDVVYDPRGFKKLAYNAADNTVTFGRDRIKVEYEVCVSCCVPGHSVCIDRGCCKGKDVGYGAQIVVDNLFIKKLGPRFLGGVNPEDSPDFVRAQAEIKEREKLLASMLTTARQNEEIAKTGAYLFEVGQKQLNEELNGDLHRQVEGLKLRGKGIQAETEIFANQTLLDAAADSYDALDIRPKGPRSSTKIQITPGNFAYTILRTNVNDYPGLSLATHRGNTCFAVERESSAPAYLPVNHGISQMLSVLDATLLARTSVTILRANYKQYTRTSCVNWDVESLRGTKFDTFAPSVVVGFTCTGRADFDVECATADYEQLINGVERVSLGEGDVLVTLDGFNWKGYEVASAEGEDIVATDSDEDAEYRVDEVGDDGRVTDAVPNMKPVAPLLSYAGALAKSEDNCLVEDVVPVRTLVNMRDLARKHNTPPKFPVAADAQPKFQPMAAAKNFPSSESASTGSASGSSTSSIRREMEEERHRRAKRRAWSSDAADDYYAAGVAFMEATEDIDVDVQFEGLRRKSARSVTMIDECFTPKDADGVYLTYGFCGKTQEFKLSECRPVNLAGLKASGFVFAEKVLNGFTFHRVRAAGADMVVVKIAEYVRRGGSFGVKCAFEKLTRHYGERFRREAQKQGDVVRADLNLEPIKQVEKSASFSFKQVFVCFLICLLFIFPLFAPVLAFSVSVPASGGASESERGVKVCKHEENVGFFRTDNTEYCAPFELGERPQYECSKTLKKCIMDRPVLVSGLSREEKLSRAKESIHECVDKRSVLLKRECCVVSDVEDAQVSACFHVSEDVNLLSNCETVYVQNVTGMNDFFKYEELRFTDAMSLNTAEVREVFADYCVERPLVVGDVTIGEYIYASDPFPLPAKETVFDFLSDLDDGEVEEETVFDFLSVNVEDDDQPEGESPLVEKSDKDRVVVEDLRVEAFPPATEESESVSVNEVDHRVVDSPGTLDELKHERVSEDVVDVADSSSVEASVETDSSATGENVVESYPNVSVENGFSVVHEESPVVVDVVRESEESDDVDESVPDMKLYDAYVSALGKLREEYTNQTHRFWRIIQASVRNYLVDLSSPNSVNVVIYTTADMSETATCFSKSFLTIVNELVGETGPIGVLNLDHDVGYENTVQQFEDLFTNSSAVVLGIENLSGKSALALHGFVEDFEPKRERFLSVYIVTVRSSVIEVTTAEEKLSSIWGDLEEDKRFPVLSRLGANSVFYRPGKKNISCLPKVGLGTHAAAAELYPNLNLYDFGELRTVDDREGSPSLVLYKFLSIMAEETPSLPNDFFFVLRGCASGRDQGLGPCHIRFVVPEELLGDSLPLLTTTANLLSVTVSSRQNTVANITANTYDAVVKDFYSSHYYGARIFPLHVDVAVEDLSSMCEATGLCADVVFVSVGVKPLGEGVLSSSVEVIPTMRTTVIFDHRYFRLNYKVDAEVRDGYCNLYKSFPSSVVSVKMPFCVQPEVTYNPEITFKGEGCDEQFHRLNTGGVAFFVLNVSRVRNSLCAISHVQLDLFGGSPTGLRPGKEPFISVGEHFRTMPLRRTMHVTGENLTDSFIIENYNLLRDKFNASAVFFNGANSNHCALSARPFCIPPAYNVGDGNVLGKNLVGAVGIQRTTAYFAKAHFDFDGKVWYTACGEEELDTASFRHSVERELPLDDLLVRTRTGFSQLDVNLDVLFQNSTNFTQIMSKLEISEATRHVVQLEMAAVEKKVKASPLFFVEYREHEHSRTIAKVEIFGFSLLKFLNIGLNKKTYVCDLCNDACDQYAYLEATVNIITDIRCLHKAETGVLNSLVSTGNSLFNVERVVFILHKSTCHVSVSEVLDLHAARTMGSISLRFWQSLFMSKKRVVNLDTMKEPHIHAKNSWRGNVVLDVRTLQESVSAFNLGHYFYPPLQKSAATLYDECEAMCGDCVGFMIVGNDCKLFFSEGVGNYSVEAIAHFVVNQTLGLNADKPGLVYSYSISGSLITFSINYLTTTVNVTLTVVDGKFKFISGLMELKVASYLWEGLHPHYMGSMFSTVQGLLGRTSCDDAMTEIALPYEGVVLLPTDSLTDFTVLDCLSSRYSYSVVSFHSFASILRKSSTVKGEKLLVSVDIGSTFEGWAPKDCYDWYPLLEQEVVNIHRVADMLNACGNLERPATVLSYVSGFLNTPVFPDQFVKTDVFKEVFKGMGSIVGERFVLTVTLFQYSNTDSAGRIAYAPVSGPMYQNSFTYRGTFLEVVSTAEADLPLFGNAFSVELGSNAGRFRNYELGRPKLFGGPLRFEDYGRELYQFFLFPWGTGKNALVIPNVVKCVPRNDISIVIAETDVFDLRPFASGGGRFDLFVNGEIVAGCKVAGTFDFLSDKIQVVQQHVFEHVGLNFGVSTSSANFILLVLILIFMLIYIKMKFNKVRDLSIFVLYATFACVLTLLFSLVDFGGTLVIVFFLDIIFTLLIVFTSLSVGGVEHFFGCVWLLRIILLYNGLFVYLFVLFLFLRMILSTIIRFSIVRVPLAYLLRYTWYLFCIPPWKYTHLVSVEEAYLHLPLISLDDNAMLSYGHVCSTCINKDESTFFWATTTGGRKNEAMLESQRGKRVLQSDANLFSDVFGSLVTVSYGSSTSVNMNGVIVSMFTIVVPRHLFLTSGNTQAYAAMERDIAALASKGELSITLNKKTVKVSNVVFVGCLAYITFDSHVGRPLGYEKISLDSAFKNRPDVQVGAAINYRSGVTPVVIGNNGTVYGALEGGDCGTPLFVYDGHGWRWLGVHNTGINANVVDGQTFPVNVFLDITTGVSQHGKIDQSDVKIGPFRVPIMGAMVKALMKKVLPGEFLNDATKIFLCDDTSLLLQYDGHVLAEEYKRVSDMTSIGLNFSTAVFESIGGNEGIVLHTSDGPVVLDEKKGTTALIPLLLCCLCTLLFVFPLPAMLTWFVFFTVFCVSVYHCVGFYNTVFVVSGELVFFVLRLFFYQLSYTVDNDMFVRVVFILVVCMTLWEIVRYRSFDFILFLLVAGVMASMFCLYSLTYGYYLFANLLMMDPLSFVLFSNAHFGLFSFGATGYRFFNRLDMLKYFLYDGIFVIRVYTFLATGELNYIHYTVYNEDGTIFDMLSKWLGLSVEPEYDPSNQVKNESATVPGKILKGGVSNLVYSILGELVELAEGVGSHVDTAILVRAQQAYNDSERKMEDAVNSIIELSGALHSLLPSSVLAGTEENVVAAVGLHFVRANEGERERLVDDYSTKLIRGILNARIFAAAVGSDRNPDKITGQVRELLNVIRTDTRGIQEQINSYSAAEFKKVYNSNFTNGSEVDFANMLNAVRRSARVKYDDVLKRVKDFNRAPQPTLVYACSLMDGLVAALEQFAPNETPSNEAEITDFVKKVGQVIAAENFGDIDLNSLGELDHIDSAIAAVDLKSSMTTSKAEKTSCNRVRGSLLELRAKVAKVYNIRDQAEKQAKAKRDKDMQKAYEQEKAAAKEHRDAAQRKQRVTRVVARLFNTIPIYKSAGLNAAQFYSLLTGHFTPTENKKVINTLFGDKYINDFCFDSIFKKYNTISDFNEPEFEYNADSRIHLVQCYSPNEQGDFVPTHVMTGLGCQDLPPGLTVYALKTASGVTFVEGILKAFNENSEGVLYFTQQKNEGFFSSSGIHTPCGQPLTCCGEGTHDFTGKCGGLSERELKLHVQGCGKCADIIKRGSHFNCGRSSICRKKDSLSSLEHSHTLNCCIYAMQNCRACQLCNVCGGHPRAVGDQQACTSSMFHGRRCVVTDCEGCPLDHVPKYNNEAFVGNKGYAIKDKISFEKVDKNLNCYAIIHNGSKVGYVGTNYPDKNFVEVALHAYVHSTKLQQHPNVKIWLSRAFHAQNKVWASFICRVFDHYIARGSAMLSVQNESAGNESCRVKCIHNNVLGDCCLNLLWQGHTGHLHEHFAREGSDELFLACVAGLDIRHLVFDRKCYCDTVLKACKNCVIRTSVDKHVRAVYARLFQAYESGAITKVGKCDECSNPTVFDRCFVCEHDRYASEGKIGPKRPRATANPFDIK
ncbi:orf1a [Aplysia californica nido-like virus]|nr:orf1a [Aplysia californica nido-like virus]AXG63956.1 orf1a [Aplysia californica nido-like virus]